MLIVSMGIFRSVAFGNDRLAPRFLTRTWVSEDGLPGNVVRSVAQSTDGYLWVATAEGVVRFDGIRFSRFETEPDATLSRLPPKALYPLENGEVWVTTSRGGLLRWFRGRLSLVWPDVSGDSQKPQLLPAMQVIQHDKRVWVERGAEVWRSTPDGNLERVDRSADIDAVLHRASEEAASTGRGISVESDLRLRDRKGRIWSYSVGGQLAVNWTGDAGVEALPVLAPGRRLNELYEDREGTLWIATAVSGLVQISERRADVLTSADGLTDAAALALLEDRDGALWVGTKAGGVDRLKGEAVEHFNLGDSGIERPVSALFEDQSGKLWAATREGSVFAWDGSKFRVAFGQGKGPAKVVAIVQDQAGNLWFGGRQGISAWDGKASRRMDASSGLASAEITALCAGRSGEVWAGTNDGQLFREFDGRFERVGSDESFRHRAISSLLAEADGSLWITTLGAGLYRFTSGRVESIGKKTGLPDDRLTSVLDDGLGNIWLGSLSGILRASRSELVSVVRGQRRVRWLLLDRSDGLLTRECTGGFQPAAWRGQDGALWFPTGNGVVHVRPRDIELNRVIPPVVIEEIRANGKTLRFDRGTLEVGPGRTRLAFDFTALSLCQPEKVRFRIRLLGLERDWREAGAQRTVAYDSVPPGNYRFQVLAANNDGIWNETGAVIMVDVLPHFWETRWFRTLIVASVLSGAVGIGWMIARLRWRSRMLQLELASTREAERARIARDLHDDLGASLTEVSILAHLAAEERSLVDKAEPLSDLAQKVRGLVGTLDEIVWAINPRHDTLASLVEYIGAYASEFLGGVGISLRLDLPTQAPDGHLDPDRRHSLFLAVREVLNNAVKHSGATEISLCIETKSSGLVITIADNGRGFEVQPTALGDGLGNLRERLARLGGTSTLESEVGQGTTVRFELPLHSTS